MTITIIKITTRIIIKTATSATRTTTTTLTTTTIRIKIIMSFLIWFNILCGLNCLLLFTK